MLQSAPEFFGVVMSETAAARQGWWRSLLQRDGIARGDIAGGLTAAMVLPAIEGSYGLVAFGPMGARPRLLPHGRRNQLKPFDFFKWKGALNEQFQGNFISLIYLELRI